MSDQPKEQATRKRAPKARDALVPETKPDLSSSSARAPEVASTDRDPMPAVASAGGASPAAAALARAIEGARQPMDAPKPEATSDTSAVKASAPTIQVPPRAAAAAPGPAPAAAWRRSVPRAAAIVCAVGAGWVGGSQLFSGASGTAGTPAWAEAASAGIRESREDVVRLAGDVRALKVTLEALKEGLDKPRPDAGARQILERIDRTERVAQDASARLIKVAEQLERIEREPSKAAGVVAERLERIERQVIATANTVAASTPVPVAAPAKAAVPAPPPIPDPTQTASIPKFDPRQTPIEGWVLLEVYDGAALIEGRNKAHEVTPGQNIPGVGKVLSIEKRGKAWIVVTDKGFIGTETR